MSHCTFPGNSDMYGLGIRLSFYIQWYSTILSTWLAPSESDSLYLSNAFFVSATFLALIIQTLSSSSFTPLKPIEIYIILLLTFGAYLALIPLHVIRLLTACDGKYDPTRYSRVPASPVFSVLNFGLLVAVCGFQIWFWGKKVPGLKKEIGCAEYGFLFRPIRLDCQVFIVLNLIFYVLLLVFCGGMLVVKIGVWMEWWDRRSSSSENGRGHLSGGKILILQKINSLMDLIVASTITTATELVIRWNGITNVANISSAGQTIPLILSVAMLIRVLYVFRRYLKNGGTNPFTTVPESREPDELDRFVRMTVPVPLPVVVHQRRTRRDSRQVVRGRIIVV